MTSVIGVVSAVTLPRFSDSGNLSFGEFPAQIPFAPRRFFVVSEVPSDFTRGKHAHRECEQFLVCLSGTIKVSTESIEGRGEFDLVPGGIGLYIGPLVWAEQTYTQAGSILLVLASDPFDANDYISDKRELEEYWGVASTNSSKPEMI